MGKKSSPPPPDYTAIANTQAANSADQTNSQTWANRPNQTSPWGSITWDATKTTDPTTGKPVTQWAQNTTIDPTLQNALNSQIATQQGRSDLANSMMGAVGQNMGQPLSYSQFSPMAAAPQAFGFNPNHVQQVQGGGMPQAQAVSPWSTPGAQNIDTSRMQGPQLNSSMGANAGSIQQGLDFGGLHGVGDATSTRQRAEDAIYGAQTSRLDPQYAKQQGDLETQLANQGITRNSDAYSRAMGDFNLSKNDAYAAARNAAITGGGAEAQRDYTMDMGLRQQQANEALQSGNFTNAAQQQGFGQDLMSGQANNAALGQAFGFGQSAQAQQLNAQNALFNQQLAGSNQGFGQALQANNQYFNQGTTNQTNAFNQRLAGQGQQFQQQLAGGNQAFGQQMQSASYQNQLRQQQIAEALQQRSLPLNEMNALLSGQQVNSPQFQNFATSGQAQTPDLLGAAQAQYQASLGNQSAGNAMTGNLLGAFGQAAGAFFGGGSGSDRRVKRSIRKLRRDPRGFNVYSFRYIGMRRRYVGVMAQELARVMPSAVQVRGGVMEVDYSQLGAL